MAVRSLLQPYQRVLPAELQAVGSAGVHAVAQLASRAVEPHLEP